jgi:hypothetical protein
MEKLVAHSFMSRSDVLTAVTMKNVVLWDVVPCRSCVNRRLGETYRLHLQGRKIGERGTSVSRWLQMDRRFGGTYHIHLQGRKIRKWRTSVRRWLQVSRHFGGTWSHLLTLVPRSRIFTLKWRRYVPPKRRFTQDPHGATSQKTAFFRIYPHRE